MAVRSCGTCGMCCKLVGVRELDKPMGQWCKHFVVGKGCSIYETRPQSCRDFTCGWLETPQLPDELRPDKSKAVLYMHPSAKPEDGVSIFMDKGAEDRIKSGFLRNVINNIDRRGFRVIVNFFGGGKMVGLHQGRWIPLKVVGKREDGLIVSGDV